MTEAVCLYHNGNSRVVELYKQQFNHLPFKGNLSEHSSFEAGLYEICYADATLDKLHQAKKHGVKIIRHVSDYNDDSNHLLPECQLFPFDVWLEVVVAKNLCVVDKIVNESNIATESVSECAIITMGRTASSHLEYAWRQKGKESFEYHKCIDQRFLNAESAVLNWREDQWDCITSLWITKVKFNAMDAFHKVKGQQSEEYNFTVSPVEPQWLETDWLNMCRMVFDHALFFKYVLGKPMSIMTTEHVVKTYVSIFEKVPYDKNRIIIDCEKSKNLYNSSNCKFLIDSLYENTKHLGVYK